MSITFTCHNVNLYTPTLWCPSHQVLVDQRISEGPGNIVFCPLYAKRIVENPRVLLCIRVLLSTDIYIRSVVTYVTGVYHISQFSGLNTNMRDLIWMGTVFAVNGGLLNS